MNSLEYYKNMVGNEYPNIKLFKTMDQLLDYGYTTFNKDVAISWLGNEKTYDDVYHDVAKTRKLFADKGIKKGQNVLLVFKNDYNFVKSFFALTTLGAIAVIVPPSLPKEAIFGSYMKFDGKALVYGEEVEAVIKEIIPNLKGAIIVSYNDLNNLGNEELEADKTVNTADCATIMFTGGTTGKPKGAILSHRALLRGAYNGVFGIGPVFRNKYMVLLPFFHVFGLVRNLLASFNSGSNCYLVKDMMNFVKEIKGCAPNIMILVPALANLIYGLIKKYGRDFVGGKLEIIICGGAHVTPESIRNLDSVGVKALQGYGLTETANLTTGNVNYLDKDASVGIVYPGQDVKIVDGEIWIKGDNLFDGYYKDPEETKHALSEDGYLKTGDLGKFDEDGFLYIVGRNKNIIVLDNGENISPEIIEDKLDNIPLIAASMVYEDKNESGRGIIAAKIFPNYNAMQAMGYTDPEFVVKQLVEKVNSQMPPFMRVMKVVVLKEDFKRSGAMKIIRSANL